MPDEITPAETPPFERGNRGMIKATVANVCLALSRPDVCAVHLRVGGAYRRGLQFAPTHNPDEWHVFKYQHVAGLRRTLARLGFRPVPDAMLREAINLVAPGDYFPKRPSLRQLRR